ncbi:MAG: hypothetical protein ABFR62_08200 [Bacteroidota bacterium]
MLKFKTFIVALILIITSCSKDSDSNSIKVSFEKSEQHVEHIAQDVAVKLILSEEAKDDIKIDLKFGGSAVKLHDYLSPDELSLRKGYMGSEFNVKTLINPDNLSEKTIEIGMTLPSGYTTGENPKTTIYINAD